MIEKEPAPEPDPGPFICGVIGKRGPDGLHDGYWICPAPGADVVVVFMRVKPGGE